MSVQLTRQSVIEECLDLELTPEQQAQFEKFSSAEDKADYLEALLADEAVIVSVASRHEVQGRKEIREQGEAEPQPVAKQEFLDYLEKSRREGMPEHDYKVRFAEILDDGDLEMVTETIRATSYSDAVETLFKQAVETGRMIDRIYPSQGEQAPVLIQLDRNVFDLTPVADSDTVLKVGAIGLNISRHGHDLSITMHNSLSGEEIDAMSISDKDYLQALRQDEDHGPSLG